VQPANELLSDRQPNEAYLAANAGTAYAVYFPAGGNVQCDLSAARRTLVAHWINIGSGEWGPTQELTGGQRASLTPPDKGNWAAAIVEPE